MLTGRGSSGVEGEVGRGGWWVRRVTGVACGREFAMNSHLFSVSGVYVDSSSLNLSNGFSCFKNLRVHKIQSVSQACQISSFCLSAKSISSSCSYASMVPDSLREFNHDRFFRYPPFSLTNNLVSFEEKTRFTSKACSFDNFCVSFSFALINPNLHFAVKLSLKLECSSAYTLPTLFLPEACPLCRGVTSLVIENHVDHLDFSSFEPQVLWVGWWWCDARCCDDRCLWCMMRVLGIVQQHVLVLQVGLCFTARLELFGFLFDIQDHLPENAGWIIIVALDQEEMLPEMKGDFPEDSIIPGCGLAL
ncbi:hypothetical protein Tco_1537978 [Tanacetum coccineum]